MAQQDLLPLVKNTIAVSSGKGGVGKSTVAVNLAIGLAQNGAKVGLLDADVYGPSVPKMLDGVSKPKAEPGKITPLEKYGVKFISMALFTDQNTPVIWRGPMASRLIQQFISEVEWGELDYLLVDMPPGTGDVQLTLVQTVPLTGAVVVTTPQEVAVDITTRGLKMFEQVNVPIIGIIENMSYFLCPHCDKRTDVFRHGGGEKAAGTLSVPFLGGVPLDPALALAGDAGNPVVNLKGSKRTASSEAFAKISSELVAHIERVKDKSGKNGENVRIAPKEVKGDGSNMVIEWEDGLTSKIPFEELRVKCPCATCVDETTGQRVITPDRIQAGVSPQAVNQVGRYAVQIKWSDGHDTGIYSYNYLRELSESLAKS